MAYKYKHFIPQNIAPNGAESIGVYDSNGNKVQTIQLGRLAPVTNEKLYSFGLVSDVHIHQTTPEWKADTKLDATLSYFEEYGCDFCVQCGDLVNEGFYVSIDGSVQFSTGQWDRYDSVRQKHTIPIYGICGNHESYNSHPVTDHLDYLNTYTGKSAVSFTLSVNETTERNEQVSVLGDDVFILVGQPSQSVVMSDTDFTWLGETLEANKDKRCFVFVHPYIEEDSGDAMDVRENSIFDYWGTTKTTAFINLLNQYENVILFHGHSHMKFENQVYDVNANYTERNGFKSVHIPSLSIPRDINFDTMASQDDRSGSQGYIVDVYDDCIVLNGMDFINEIPVPLGTYKIKTV